VAQLDVKNMHWQKAYGPQAGALVQNSGGKVLAGAGATLERFDSVIITLRHGNASVRTHT